jgi:outer membrane protein TolC
MKFIITIFISFILLQAKAQDTMVMKDNLSLHEILEHIKLHSDHLKMYDAQARSLDEAAKGARSWMPPELGTGFWMVPYNPSLWKKGNNGTNGMGQYMISAQQMIPNRKRQNAEQSYMGAMSSVTTEEKQAKQNDLFAEAKKNFYQWMVAKKKMDVINENLKLLDFMIKSAEIRYKNGVDKISAYYKTKAAMGTSANMKLMLENEINQKRIALNTLMHRDRTIIFDIDTLIDIKDYAAVTIDSSALVSSRSDLKAIEKQMEVTLLQQDLEKAKLKPEFGIRYDHMFGFGGTPMQYSLMGMVKIPLARWSAKGTKATIESLKWKTVSQQSEQLAMINEAMGMAYSMKAEIETRQRQMKLYEEDILPAFKRNYMTTQLAYEQNTEDLFMLYDAWEKLNMTQLEYLDLQEQLFTMNAEFERILEIKE